ncbi:MAG: hypothetical protein QM682_17795 [Paracoccus sp. (in: a-proteobacteria)]|uniref:hypothetical protein n=1 Tax=Paracoccus sp. TaxID=267 RepID=UPI0039E6F83A
MSEPSVMIGCPMGCAPGRIALRAVPPDTRAAPDQGADPAPLLPEDDRRHVAPRLPEVLEWSTRDWRAACLAQVAHIPSGYTYLAQLMGHDIGSSTPSDAVPYVDQAGGRRAPFYNLIDNPLTLETIYGPGPSLLAHIYDPETMLFRLTPGARLARIYARGRDSLSDADPRPIRALYDERNRDSLMLHELAVAWMQFHNLCARRLMTQGLDPLTAYCQARAHVVRVWHAVLRDDLLPRFLHPQIAALDPAALPPVWELGETSLLAGLCRSFHGLPLAAYPLGRSGVHNLGKLLKRGYDISEAEAAWQIDWALFFGTLPEGPMTGLSASVASELRAPVRAAAVMALDNDAAVRLDPMRPGSTAIQAAIAALPGDWPARLAPARLAQDFNAAFPASPIRIDTAALRWGPLFQFLMVEAQLHGRLGGFGPLGSALLMASVLGAARRVVLARETRRTAALPRPTGMLDLLNLTRMEKTK